MPLNPSAISFLLKESAEEKPCGREHPKFPRVNFQQKKSKSCNNSSLESWIRGKELKNTETKIEREQRGILEELSGVRSGERSNEQGVKRDERERKEFIRKVGDIGEPEEQGKKRIRKEDLCTLV
jgi:hypothetical protein